MFCAVSSLDILCRVGFSQVLPLVRARVGPEEGFLVVVGGGTDAIEALQGQEGVEVYNDGLRACVAGDGQLLCACLLIFDGVSLAVNSTLLVSVCLHLTLCHSLSFSLSASCWPFVYGCVFVCVSVSMSVSVSVSVNAPVLVHASVFLCYVGAWTHVRC